MKGVTQYDMIKKRKINIDIFGWQLMVIESGAIQLRRALEWVGAAPDDTENTIEENEIKSDGGYSFINNDSKRGLIVVFPSTTEEERASTIGHEKRHIEDRILGSTCINDIETAAYLAGYLSAKLHGF